MRLALVDSFRRPKDSRVFGIPEDWRPDHPVTTVRRGYNLWRASGYQRMPSREEVEAIEPSWESDLMLMYEIDQWVNRED